MHFQPDSPGPAGFALRTTGDPRRGRCETRTGAVSSLLDHAAVHTASLRVGITPSFPAPRRFAPPAARLSSRRSSALRLVPSLPVLASVCLSRGPAAPTPRAVQAPYFSLFLLSLPRSSSRAASWQWPGSPAGNPQSAPPTLNGCLLPALSRAQPFPVRRITRRAADFASLRSLAADAHG